MDPYILLLFCLGLVILAVSWLPELLRNLPLSLPILCVAFGAVLFSLPGTGPDPDPLKYAVLTERLTELIVIVALMGAGLKIDRPLGWRRWIITWRLLSIAMPLSILGIAGLGWWLLGLTPAAALLLGAVLAPTDPVLASDVQVGPPNSGEEDEVRFSLTSEAGLNDGLSFPFTHLAIAMALYGSVPGAWTLEWFAVAVLWKIGAGVACGYLLGKLLGVVIFGLLAGTRIPETGAGLVVLAVTLVSYGLAEMIHGYGFLAVFVTALTMRHEERSHHYHAQLHDFAEQIERLFMMVLLVCFGGAITGGLLAPLSWTSVAVGVLVLVLVRPIAGVVSLLGLPQPRRERLAIGAFGIRGIGSFYYLAYAINTAAEQRSELIWVTEAMWALVGFVVLTSIVGHGVLSTPVMRSLDLQRRRYAARQDPGSGD